MDIEYICSPRVMATNFTPLMIDVISGKINSENLVNINAKNSKGWTALIIACRNSNTFASNEIVEILLKNGADLNLQDEDGWTPLHWAAATGHRNALTCLMSLVAQPHILTNKRQTLAHCAALNGHQTIISYLQEIKAPLSTLLKRWKFPITLNNC